MLHGGLAPSPVQRSYGFLIERLLPAHLLPELRRARLETALARNDRDELYGETVAALVELTARGLFEELPAAGPGARIFRRLGGADCIRLEAPRNALQQASRPTGDVAESLTDDASITQARVAGSVAGSGAGSAAGSVAGSGAGSATGSAAGSVARSGAGSVAGFGAGPVAGSVAGTVPGFVAGPAAGPVAGSVAGSQPDTGARAEELAAALADAPIPALEPAPETAPPARPREAPAVTPAGEPPAAPAGLDEAALGGENLQGFVEDPLGSAGTADHAAAAAAEPWTQVEPFLDLAGIEPHLEPFGDRLRRIVAQLEQALPGARARLLCLESEGVEALGDGAVQVLERAAVEEMPHFREALLRGETQFATSAPVGSDPASGRIAAAVPIYVAGEPWGLLQVTWPQGHPGSVAELARLLSPLARLVAMAIQNQTTLEKLVFIDPLTEVYNRAFYDRQVALEMERANRTNQKFALLVMDVDDFKTINDRFGHRAGDQVLSQLAREVRGRMRKIDLMFRYGGEEFVLLLPGADLEEAQRTAERLRLVVNEQRFRIDASPAPLRATVSIGGSVYPDQSRTKTGIFNAADAALYRAKHEGKNRVAF